MGVIIMHLASNIVALKPFQASATRAFIEKSLIYANNIISALKINP